MTLITTEVRGKLPRSDRLSDSVLILLALTVVQRLIGFGRSILFCLWLSTDELGQWDIAFGFLMLAVPVAVLSLPGCFGRYVAFYRQRGVMRPFLKRTLSVTALLAVTAAVGVALTRGWFSHFIFGRDDRTELVLVLAASLLALSTYNVIIELFVSLRLQRIASGLELLNTIVFASLGAALLAGWRAEAVSVVLSYAGACLLSSVAALVWCRGMWWPPQDGTETPHLPHLAVWSKILPFAAALWASNGLANLFGIADRYVLIHYSGQAPADALAMVGEYHSSRIVPLLLVAVAGLLAGVILPFFSHEWEAGHKDNVVAGLNLLLKSSGVVLLAASAAVLFLSPLIFGWLFHGKFTAAPDILALTLVCACWSSLVCLSKNYLWCAERAALVSVAYAVGLVASVGLSLALVPLYGLRGAAFGTCVAQGVLLLLVYGFSRAYGFVPHRATYVLSLAPLVLLLGPWVSLAVLLVILMTALSSDLVLNRREKAEIASTFRRYRLVLESRAFGPAREPDPPGEAASDAVPELGPRADARPPLKVMFVHTSLFVGGAESLLMELVRRLDRARFLPEICCLKDRGPMYAQVPQDVPVFHNLIRHKYDAPVVVRLARLLRRRQVDVVVTVGAGDRMFWGRLAAWLVRVPVIASWIHSTGWPDRIGKLNRLLTPLTDAFIAVAEKHGRYLVEDEGLPADRVHVVLNGIDIEKFCPRPARRELREELHLPAAAPVAGIVARLSPEKNHEMFLQVAARVAEQCGEARFLIVGDGPERGRLEIRAAELGLAEVVQFVGDRSDVPELLAVLDVFLLTSRSEASPVSILEALATGKPVVATCVGSVPEMVHNDEVGYLVEPGDAAAMAARVLELFREPRLAWRLGSEGRRLVVQRYATRAMLDRYQDLLEQLYDSRQGRLCDEESAEEDQLLGAAHLLPGES